MGLAHASTRLREADYLEIERTAAFKSEFFHGEMFAMAGGTPQHSLIAANSIRALGNRLEKKPCTAYTADLRIKVEATGLMTYPDVSVVCGPLRYAEGTDDTIVNPTVLVEVLSESTEAYDRGTKFGHYRQIPSLRDYLLVSQREPKIDLFTRQQDERWLLNALSGLNAVLELASLSISLPLSEVFTKVEFVPSGFRPLYPQR
jgi:Uma2 family endonuclease